MADLQPKLDALKEKYKNQKEQYGKELMEFYRREKINPYSSCLPLLIQLPILIAVYQVFINGIKSNDFSLLYPFINNPGTINSISLGFINLASSSFYLALLAGIAQFWQSWLMLNKSKQTNISPNKTTANINKQMMYFMPVLTVVIGSSFPAGLTLYWFVMTLLSAFQQIFILKKLK